MTRDSLPTVPSKIRGLSASAVVASLIAGSTVPIEAEARDPGLTPASAEGKRQAIRDAARSDLDQQDWGAAAETLESNAALLGDPITFLEAGEARLRLAERDRSIEEAERAIETTTVALDILHFYRQVAQGESRSRWLVIEPGDADRHIATAAEQIAAAQSLIEEIEHEQSESGQPVADASAGEARRREARPGTGMLAAGSAFSLVGVGGLSMVVAGVAIGASKQNEVETLVIGMDDEEIARLDDEGHKANLVAYVGAGVAVTGLAVGIPLVVFGLKKRRASETVPETAQLRVLPVLGRGTQGLVFSGRF